MRHQTWQYLIDWVSRMTRKYGGTVYEKETEELCSRTWDWGQALCRETYGRDWMNSEEFSICNDCPPEDPAPEKFVADAKKWESGTHPDWVDVTKFNHRVEEQGRKVR